MHCGPIKKYTWSYNDNTQNGCANTLTWLIMVPNKQKMCTASLEKKTHQILASINAKPDKVNKTHEKLHFTRKFCIDCFKIFLDHGP